MASSFELKGPHFCIISLSSSAADLLETILHVWVELLMIYQDSEDSINKFNFGFFKNTFWLLEIMVVPPH